MCDEVMNEIQAAIAAVDGIDYAKLRGIIAKTDELLFRNLQFGRNVIETLGDVQQYWYSYGKQTNFIVSRLAELFESSSTKSNLHVYDFGCGPGSSLSCLLDGLKAKDLFGRLRSINLIEPSEISLNIASFIAEQYVSSYAGPDVCPDVLLRPFPPVGIKKIQSLCDDNLASQMGDHIASRTHKSSDDTFIHLMSSVINVDGFSARSIVKASLKVPGEHVFLIGCQLSHDADEKIADLIINVILDFGSAADLVSLKKEIYYGTKNIDVRLLIMRIITPDESAEERIDL